MKPIHLLASFLLLFTLQSHAQILSDAKPGSAEFLISACQEYVELYGKKDEPRFGAFLTTSKEESFRAGYCLGVIMHNDKTCTSSYFPSVYSSAKVIASYSREYAYSELQLLEQTICL